MIIASPRILNYFEKINLQVANMHSIAQQARSKGYDPEKTVEITLAKNMAERVVGLISVIAPQIVNSGVVERITELEAQYGALDWRVALKIAEEIAQQKFCKFETKIQAIEVGIRTGFAYSTVGVVSSPLDGLVNIQLKKRNDGRGEYLSLNFAGPIRNAGGTNAAFCVIIGDYVRKKMNYDTYDATEEEIKRTKTELQDYHERITNLQYVPSEEEIDFLVKKMPVEIAGEASEDIEVSNYKDLQRIPTNFIRSGFCLLYSSCIPLKAPKLWNQLSKWGMEFSMEQWNFLEEFIKIQKKAKSKGGIEIKKDAQKITPDYTYITDLVAGRPVLGYPLRSGGFRLRYGRARTSGYSAQAVHPAMMHILDDYLAIGTQLKTERPGKGAAYTSVDTIEGPIVKLEDESVIKIETVAEAKIFTKKIKEILYLGDVLISYGDFFDRAHPLAPAGYCEEWWVKELEKATVALFGTIDTFKLSQLTEVPQTALDAILQQPLKHFPSAEYAYNLAIKTKTPLHPRYTHHWKSISKEEAINLLNWMREANIIREKNKIIKLTLPYNMQYKRTLELIGIPHITSLKQYVVLEEDSAIALLANLGIYNTFDIETSLSKLKNTNAEIIDGFEAIKIISETILRDKSGTFIGSRMGRPEKSKQREMTGRPNGIFPVGEEGGRLKSITEAVEKGTITSEFAIYHCNNCNAQTIYPKCEQCDQLTEERYFCETCNSIIISSACPKHGKAEKSKRLALQIKKYYLHALQKAQMSVPPDIIKGVKETMNDGHHTEHLTKAVLRAKYNMAVNKDGTIRYDSSEIPLTHFKPKEIGASIEQLKNLGYTQDIKNKILENENQILELLPQDILLPCCPDSPDQPADAVFYSITKYVDNLLQKLYELPAYYNLKQKEDLIGHYIIGLAPHTSAGLVGRIIGFSKTQGFFAHPYFHAACRRDCDGDEIGFMLLMDAFLNFSKKYLPQSRGSTMDAPLVLTSTLAPTEVDDMAFNLDIAWTYPLELYEATQQCKSAKEVPILQIKATLNKIEQYEGMGFTHDTDDINSGILCSAYKTLPTMKDKLQGQMELATKIRAVDVSDVARLVIEKHFIKDTKGNLRRFSNQEFRCVKCNDKARRPPLKGNCVKCGGKYLFTVAEGSVLKYLEPTLSLAKAYAVSPYILQSIELLQLRIEAVFGKDKEKQTGLGAWFG